MYWIIPHKTRNLHFVAYMCLVLLEKVLKAQKFKSGQRQWFDGTLIVTAAVQGILCGGVCCLVCK